MANTVSADASPPQLLTRKLIQRHYVPWGTRTLARKVASGEFPRPDVSLGRKIRMWKRETVENWISRAG